MRTVACASFVNVPAIVARAPGATLSVPRFVRLRLRTSVPASTLIVPLVSKAMLRTDPVRAGDGLVQRAEVRERRAARVEVERRRVAARQHDRARRPRSSTCSGRPRYSRRTAARHWRSSASPRSPTTSHPRTPGSHHPPPCSPTSHPASSTPRTEQETRRRHIELARHRHRSRPTKRPTRQHQTRQRLRRIEVQRAATDHDSRVARQETQRNIHVHRCPRDDQRAGPLTSEPLPSVRVPPAKLTPAPAARSKRRCRCRRRRPPTCPRSR